MERRLQTRQYADLESFERDMKLIFDNCRLYNEEGTTYVKCANSLERDFKTMVKDLANGGRLPNEAPAPVQPVAPA